MGTSQSTHKIPKDATLVKSTDCLTGTNMIGKSDDKLVSTYISYQTMKYNMNIPQEIIFLCNNFYQNGKWTVYIGQKFGQEQREYSIDKYKSCQHNIIVLTKFYYSPYVCTLNVTATNKQFRHIDYEDMGLYCHLFCNELCFEKKYTTELGKAISFGPKKFGFGNVPQSATFDLYFQLIPSLRTTINTKQLNKWYKYKWDLNENMAMQTDWWWYSPNFFNEGCLCLSLRQSEHHSINEKTITINIIVLKGYDIQMERIIKITCNNKTWYQSDTTSIIDIGIGYPESVIDIGIPKMASMMSVEIYFKILSADKPHIVQAKESIMHNSASHQSFAVV